MTSGRRAPDLLGAVTTGAGIVILVGWWLDLGVLASALPGWPPTRPNTALAFVLAGAAVVWLPDSVSPARRRTAERLGLGCALLVAIIGGMTLAEYALSFDFGIDAALVGTAPELEGTAVDLRPPLSAAVGFLLLGAALMLTHLGERAGSIPQALFVMNASVFSLPLLDDLISGELSRMRQILGSLGLPSTLLFLMISAAGLLAHRSAGAGLRSGRIERTLPWVLVLLAASIWMIARGIYETSATVYGIALVGSLLFGLILWASGRFIAKSEREFEQIFALTPDFLCIADFTGRFRRVNPAASRILGWSSQELLSRPFLDFVHQDDRAATLSEMDKLATGATTLNFENRYACKDGSWRWLAWTSYPRPAEDRIYAAARDVTESRRARDEIARLNAELEAFSYSVSHDLRAPLRHANGFVRLLEKHLDATALDDTARRYLRTISSATQRMGTLIDDLLLFSRASRTDLWRQRVALGGLIEAVRNELQNETAGRSITWQIGALPEVEGDPALLRQVFANLLSNAVKYSRDRNPAIVEVGLAPPNGDGTVVFVRDNGAGFDMQYKDKLFGVFQRLHGRADFEGTGIGLALVRRIVQRHGGATWAEGKVGEGATFYVSLPSRRMEE